MKHPPSQQTKWPENAIFTVGHSTLPIERFIALLDTYGIERLVDVRTAPRSRHNPQFNAEDLGRALQQEDIDYVPLPALGGLRHAACGMRARTRSTRAGATQVFAVTPIICRPTNLQGGLKRLIALSEKKRTAIMCAEAVPWRCHRSLVADALIVRGIPVIEILV
jgi:uncharacterized protein (DUF488 family)